MVNPVSTFIYFYFLHGGITIRQYFAAMAMASDDYEAPYAEAYITKGKQYWIPKDEALIKALNDGQ